MLSKKKWMFAFVIVMLFFMLNKFENNDVLSTSYATSLLEPQKPSAIYKRVVQWIKPDELISVSAPIATPPLIEYKSIQPLSEGAILSINNSQDLYASENGFIIFTGYTKKTGKTLSILYDTGETVTFGFVKEFHQLPYTTINAGDIFASADNELLYIKVVKDGKNLDTNELIEWLSVTNE
ncbi:hypothetical protein PB01_12350 [Psychrobacillus glaciei]|uniref:M23 family peptidase n=1 Tax=Psychrobacillus glaciei TaxID=2283160 RepID=A0A5J6STJ4_9BACI|nr:hypothetical protein [Psychrobacillus glaciei]QFF99557.1 hypothetical protein PB01_12350 [Psychrobacillus glaciei]